MNTAEKKLIIEIRDKTKENYVLVYKISLPDLVTVPLLLEIFSDAIKIIVDNKIAPINENMSINISIQK